MRRAAVLGHPIAHSLSPVLHRAAYEGLGLDSWSYDAVDVTEEALADFVAGLDDTWAGLSVTMPLKQAIIGLVDHIDPLAEVTGAVNTVVFQGSGASRTLVGVNTDVYGLVTALREGGVAGAALPDDGAHGAGAHGSGRRAVVLGAGATASSTLAALAELGFPTADVYLRSLGRSGDLMRAAHRMGLSPRFHTIDKAAAAMVRADVVVSTLPPFGADPIAEQLSADDAPIRGVLLDVAYDPRVTALGAAWSGRGGTVVQGQRMLLHQAVEQVRLMTGRPGPVDLMDAALEAALAQ